MDFAQLCTTMFDVKAVRANCLNVLKMNMGLHVILLMVKCMFAVMMVRYNLIIKLFNLYCQ